MLVGPTQHSRLEPDIGSASAIAEPAPDGSGGGSDLPPITAAELTRWFGPAEPAAAPATPIHIAHQPHVVVLAVHHVLHEGRTLRGGAEKYLLQVVAALLESGARVTVNYSGDDIYGPLVRQCGAGQLRLHCSDWLDVNLGADRRFRPRVIMDRYRWLARARPDVVFAVQQGYGSAFAASLMAAKLLGCPVVASVRQMPESAYLGDPAAAPPTAGGLGLRWSRLRLAVRMRLVAACCDTLIFNSRRVAERYAVEHRWPARHMRVIANAEPPALVPRSLDPVAAASADVRAGWIRPDRDRRVVFGCVGQVNHTKGSDVVLEAFARVAARCEAIDLAFFGDGGEIEPLRARAATLGLGDRVHWRGHCDDRSAVFSNIDVLIAASRREASSNSVAEAMCRGLPCIVSDAGGLPELIEHGGSGLIVPAGSAEYLADAMLRLACDGEARRVLGDAAYMRAAACFDPQRNLGATVDAILGRVEPFRL